jgi:hypothetical protein
MNTPFYRLVITSLICLFVAFSSHAQDKRFRAIEKKSDFTDPVEMDDLLVDGESVKYLDKFFSTRDWLKTLKLKIKNTSDKPIVYVRAELEIPKAGAMEYPFLIPLVYGQIPPAPEEPTSLPNSKPLLPNKIQSLTIADSMYEILIKHLRQKKVSEVDNVKLRIDLIIFEDGTAWSNGRILYRDPKKPNRWKIKVEAKPAGASTKQPSPDKPRSYPNVSIGQIRSSVTGFNLKISWTFLLQSFK